MWVFTQIFNTWSASNMMSMVDMMVLAFTIEFLNGKYRKRRLETRDYRPKTIDLWGQVAMGNKQ